MVSASRELHRKGVFCINHALAMELRSQKGVHWISSTECTGVLFITLVQMRLTAGGMGVDLSFVWYD